MTTKRTNIQNDKAGSTRRIATGLLIFLSSAFSTNCFSPSTGGVQIGDFKQAEVEFDESRFELRQLPGSFPEIHKAKGYWTKEGDRLAAAWNSYEFHWTRVGAMCAFADNSSNENCLVCDYCVGENPGGDCPGIAGNLMAGVLTIVNDTGFMSTGNGTKVDDYQGTLGEPGESCSLNDPSQRTIVPSSSGLYRMVGNTPGLPFRFGGEAKGEAKVQVVKPGIPRTVAYQMERIESDEGSQIVSFWKWEMQGDDYWLENFSPNLRISRVRILRGTCADGSSQGLQCLIPNEAVDVKPSKLLFWTSFDGSVGTGNEANVKCYPDPGRPNGAFIDLFSCRTTANASNGIRKDLVPTYDLLLGYIPPTSQGSPPDFTKVTWLSRFNTSETAPSGADADLSTPALDEMPTDAQLIIEFTIEAN